jgi:hypothetical protein
MFERFCLVANLSCAVLLAWLCQAQDSPSKNKLISLSRSPGLTKAGAVSTQGTVVDGSRMRLMPIAEAVAIRLNRGSPVQHICELDPEPRPQNSLPVKHVRRLRDEPFIGPQEESVELR